MKKLLDIALASVVLAFLGTGCASNRQEAGALVQYSKNMDNGKPVLSDQPISKRGGGFLVFPLAFASKTGAVEKFRNREIAAGVLTPSGVTEDKKHYRKIVVTQADPRSHGAWFVIGWYKVYNLTADVWEFPMQNNAPPASVSSDRLPQDATPTPTEVHTPPLSSN